MATQQDVTTPVTYIPVSMQKQLAINAARIRGKPYEEFFNADLRIPAERLPLVQCGPLPEHLHLRPSPSDINRSLIDRDSFPDAGWALVDGSVAFAQSRMFMPGVTTEMFRWWFLWHAVEAARYTLWFPHAHDTNSVQDVSRYSDESLTYAERLYGNLNTVSEYIGPDRHDICIDFQDAAAFGVDPSIIEIEAFTLNASGRLSPANAPSLTSGLMIHLGRDTNQGMEFVSRYWIGSHLDLHRFPGGEFAGNALAAAGLNPVQLENVAYELSLHDMTEFHHLASFLPAIYDRFRGRA